MSQTHDFAHFSIPLDSLQAWIFIGRCFFFHFWKFLKSLKFVDAFEVVLNAQNNVDAESENPHILNHFRGITKTANQDMCDKRHGEKDMGEKDLIALV